MIQLQYRNNFQIQFSKKQNLKWKNANENLLFIVDNELHIKKICGFHNFMKAGLFTMTRPPQAISSF